MLVSDMRTGAARVITFLAGEIDGETCWYNFSFQSFDDFFDVAYSKALWASA
jgi:hypothetical protein